MKAFKLLASVIIVSLFAYNATGCSQEVNFGPKGLAAYADKCGAALYDDSEEWVSDANLKIDSYNWLDEDGIYCYAKEGEVADYLENEFVSGKFYSQSVDSDISIKEAAVYLFAENKDTMNEGKASLHVISMDFSSKEDAEDMYEEYADYLEMFYSFCLEQNVKEVEDKGILSTFILNEGNGFAISACVYLKNYTVMVVTCDMTSEGSIDYTNGLVDDFCDEFDLKAPSEIL